jgi:chaperonin GroEL
MSKIILRGDAARFALKKGIDEVADSVKITLGPRGRNVVLQRYNVPLITNDGVSIAREIEVKDPIEQLGVDIVKEVANKANDVAGDGTTTAIILTQAISEIGLGRTAFFCDKMAVRRGLEASSELVVSRLKEMARPVKTLEEAVQVASISAESEELGKVIGEVVMEVGKDGAVTVDESPASGIFSEIVTGMKIDKGYLSHYMVTDNEKMVVEYPNVAVLVTDKRLSSVKDIFPFLDKVISGGQKELLIIAEDVEGEALAGMIVNKVRGIMNVVAIKAPGFGERKKEIMEDIAIAVGGKVVSKSVGLDLATVEPNEVLGQISRLVVTKDQTVMIRGSLSDDGAVQERIASIKKDMESVESKHDKEQMKSRIAMLNGVVAVIRVGANTEAEAKYLKLKVEDAVNATQAAIDEGIVTGGGSALVKVWEWLRVNRPGDLNSVEFQSGVDILLESLLVPFKQIVENAGRDDFAVLLLDLRKGDQGYDAKNDIVVEDMFKAGIIDPVKVTRTALERAVSAAAILLTTEVAVAEVKKDDGHV